MRCAVVLAVLGAALVALPSPAPAAAAVGTPSITVIQYTTPATAHAFDFTGCQVGSGCGPFTLVAEDLDGRVTTSANLTPGTYTITQAADARWPINDISCEPDADTVVDTAAREVTIELGPDDDIVCAFRNRTTEITIVEDAVPADGQDFSFTSCRHGSGCGSFVLDDDNEADGTRPQRTTHVELDPGTYTITQDQVPDWRLTDVTCNTGETVDLAARTVTIDLTFGEEVVCTFKNRTQSITVVQVTDPPGDQDFRYTGCQVGAGCGSFLLDSFDNERTSRNLDPGTYTITQGEVAGWVVDRITCQPSETIDLLNGRATVDLTAGEQVLCRFFNEPRPDDETTISVIEDRSGNGASTTWDASARVALRDTASDLPVVGALVEVLFTASNGSTTTKTCTTTSPNGRCTVTWTVAETRSYVDASVTNVTASPPWDRHGATLRLPRVND